MVKIILLIIGIIAIAFACSKNALVQDEINIISVEEVKQKEANKEDLVFLDIRTPDELTGPLGYIMGAVLIPLNELPDSIESLQKYKDKEVIVYCRSGNRSKTGAKILQDAGFNAASMSGGIKAWNKEK